MSSKGNHHVITLTEYFSKLVEAAPIPTKEACHIAHFLYKMMLRYGCPEEIISDQGHEFCNRLVDRLEELTDLKHNITSAYHPQSNGLDERFNQTLKAQVQKMVNEHQDDWDNLLDNISFAYRTSSQALMKCTPFLLIFLRMKAFLAALLHASLVSSRWVVKLLGQTVEKMLDMQKSLHDQARQNIQEAQERQKRQYDTKHNSRTTLKVRDKVLLQEMKKK